jgi:hypothetical protein
MKKKLLLMALCSLGMGVAQANPILTADPQCYDPTGADAACPTGYEVSEDEGATWQPLWSDIGASTITVWEDLGPYSTGPHNLLVRSVNTWGVSDTVPFDFTAGEPAAPSGLHLVAPAGSGS